MLFSNIFDSVQVILNFENFNLAYISYDSTYLQIYVKLIYSYLKFRVNCTYIQISIYGNISANPPVLPPTNKADRLRIQKYGLKSAATEI